MKLYDKYIFVRNFFDAQVALMKPKLPLICVVSLLNYSKIIFKEKFRLRKNLSHLFFMMFV